VPERPHTAPKLDLPVLKGLDRPQQLLLAFSKLSISLAKLGDINPPAVSQPPEHACHAPPWLCSMTTDLIRSARLSPWNAGVRAASACQLRPTQ
jgi:hypothetical protein